MNDNLAVYAEVLADTTRLTTYWQSRNAMLREELDIIRLKKPVAKVNEIRWILNEPKVLFDTCVALMSAYNPRFRLPLSTNFTDKEKEKMSRAERMLLGVYRLLNFTHMNKGQAQWIRQLAYWICTGWYSVFAMAMKDGDQTVFIADPLDPSTVYPQWTGSKLTKCVRTYQTDAQTAMALAEGWNMTYTPSEGTATITVVYYWKHDSKGVWNCILFNDAKDSSMMKPMTYERKLRRIPIFVGCVGSPDRLSDEWMQHAGESVITANKDMFRYDNALISLVAQIVAETAYPNIISKTDTGDPAITRDQITGFGTVLPLKKGDELEAFKHALTPPEVQLLLQRIGGGIQRAGLPNVVYGGVPFEMSGFAISQLMAAVRYKIAPYLNVMQEVISQVFSELLTQYRESQLPKIKLFAQNPKELTKGSFFVEEFGPSDVPDVTFIDVSIPLMSPMDRMQQITFARQALQPPQLLSRETIWDEVLDVQDSEQEYSRIIQDETLEMPILKQIAAIEKLRARADFMRAQGQTEQADILMTYVDKMVAAMTPKQSPEVGGEAGISPEAMPPEASGRNPDAARAVMGLGPPGNSRRPQTAEERAASPHQARIVSPGGETLIE